MALAQVYQLPPPKTTMPKAATARRPSFQFYPADWRKDPELACCSLAARGLWIEMLCIAHESTEYGCLSINGKAMTPEQIARVVGETPTIVKKLLAELENSGVFSRKSCGAIYSRRMQKDEDLRNERASHGHKGGEHGIKGKAFGALGAAHGAKGGRPKKPAEIPVLETPPITPPLDGSETLPPSSSSSSSTSVCSVANATAADGVEGAGIATDGFGDGPKPKVTDPEVIIFTYGLGMLANAGISDKHARSFLGGLRKTHGDGPLIDKLRDCAREKPLQPLEWLAAALPPPSLPGKRAPAAENFASKNYGPAGGYAL